MKKKKMKARIHRLKKRCPSLASIIEWNEKSYRDVLERMRGLQDEVSELQKKRLSEEEIADVADRVNRLLTEDK